MSEFGKAAIIQQLMNQLDKNRERHRWLLAQIPKGAPEKAVREIRQFLLEKNKMIENTLRIELSEGSENQT